MHQRPNETMLEPAPSIHIKDNFDAIMNLVTDNDLQELFSREENI